MRVEKRNRKFGSFFGNHLSGSFIMSVAKEFTTDRNTDVKTAGNRVIEGLQISFGQAIITAEK